VRRSGGVDNTSLADRSGDDGGDDPVSAASSVLPSWRVVDTNCACLVRRPHRIAVAARCPAARVSTSVLSRRHTNIHIIASQTRSPVVHDQRQHTHQTHTLAPRASPNIIGNRERRAFRRKQSVMTLRCRESHIAPSLRARPQPEHLFINTTTLAPTTTHLCVSTAHEPFPDARNDDDNDNDENNDESNNKQS
jgi:hypothetical protein